jgi:hypothetical protein
MSAASAAYYLPTSKLPTPSSKASSKKIPTISCTNSPLIQWQTNMMLAALSVQWHCFETGKVSWFTSSPTQCLLFLEMFTKLPWSTPTFPAHKRHSANQENLTDILQKRISTVQLHKFSYSTLAVKWHTCTQKTHVIMPWAYVCLTTVKKYTKHKTVWLVAIYTKLNEWM